MIDFVINQLCNFTGRNDIKLKYDNCLHIPALSLNMNNESIIVVNKNLIPNNVPVIAHILSHEYGHHIYGHTYINPQLLNKSTIDNFENEADYHAHRFINEYHYDKSAIVRYLYLTKSPNLNTRLDILYGNYSVIQDFLRRNPNLDYMLKSKLMN